MRTEAAFRLYHNSGGLGEHLASPSGGGEVSGGQPARKSLSLVVFVGSACCWLLLLSAYTRLQLMSGGCLLTLFNSGRPPLAANPLYLCFSTYNSKNHNLASQAICSWK